MDGLNAAMDGRRSSGVPLDPSAAHNHIVPIEDSGLARRDGALRGIKLDGNFIVLERNYGGLWLESISDLDVTSNWLRELPDRDPIVIAHCEAGPLRILSNHNPVQLRLHAHDVLWPSCGNQTPSLAASVLLNTGAWSPN